MKTNMKKRTISSIVSLTMLLSSTPMVMAEWTAREDVDLRVGILGDVHLQPGNFNGENYLIKSLEATKALSGGKVDVMALTGDIVYQTEQNYSDHYDRLYADLNTYVPDADIVYAMGNHEYILNNKSADKDTESRNIFKDKTGQAVNYHYETEDGYHFITAAADGYAGVYSDATQQWLMDEIDKAIAEDVNKPVFVALHHPIDKTVVENNYEGYNDTFEAYIKTKPQVINLTAHEHAAAQIPQSIYQDGFTAFHTPLTAIGGTTNWKCDAGETAQVHQGAMIEVDDNVVSIYRYDLDTQEYIGEPWVIDIPAIVKDRSDADASNDNDNFLYSADKRSNPATPVWAEGSAISVKKKANSLSVVYPDSATVAAQPNQQDGFVAGYKLELLSNDDKVLFSKTYPSDYYKAASAKTGSFTQTISGLGYSNPYKINVYPMTPWGTFGPALSSNATTAAEIVSDRAITYEFEKVADTDSSKMAILSNAYANDGGLLVSGAGYGKAYLNQNNNPSFDFTINVPADDTYKIEYVLGQRTVSNVSAVTLDIDGTQIGTNASSEKYTEDLSLGDSFPWSYIPLRKYTVEKELTAGEHTVTLTVGPCQENGSSWLYLFAADYIRFTPKTVALPEGVTEIDLIKDENGALRTGVSASTDFQGYDANFKISSVIDGNVYSYWFSKFGLKNPYLTVDLGGVKAITEIKYLPPNGYNANVEGANDGGWYYKAGMEIQLSNSKTFDEYVTVASLPYTQDAALKLGQTLDAVLDGSINKYRYIRIYQPNSDVVGATDIYVKGYELSADDYSDVTVESLDFTSAPDAVTNVDTDELIKIKFNNDIDLSTVTSENICVVDANNTKTTVNPIVIDNRTVGIYPGDLLSKTTYNVVVSGVMDAAGVPLALYKSAETFTTAEIIKAAYVENKALKNVAVNKSAYRASDKSSLSGWTNGIENIDGQFNDVNWLKGYNSGDYGIVDLGKPYSISAAGIMSTEQWYHFAPSEIYGTNDPECKLEDADLIATITEEDARKSEIIGGAVTKTVATATGGEYRYILFNPGNAAGDGILGKEVYVYAWIDNTPVTIAKTANVTDGMEKVTNVSNCRPEEGYTYVSKQMEITLSDNADMSTVTNATLTVNDGTKNVAYTPVIDGKTVKIDLSELDSNLTYTVTVTNGVKSDSGATGRGESFSFTTGLIAKVAYKEGNVIKNAAFGRTAWKSAEADGTTSLSGLTDKIEKDSPQFSPNHMLPDYANTTTPGIYGIIDLGNEYEIASVGVRGNDTSAWWNYYSVTFYCMDEVPATGDGLTNSLGTIGRDLAMLTTVPVIKTAPTSGRYIMFKKTDTSATLKEVYVFVSVPAQNPDVYFTYNAETNMVTANVENGGNNKLILASYDSAKNLGNVAIGENGKASIEKLDGYTYKAMLWESMESAEPVTKAIKY